MVDLDGAMVVVGLYGEAIDGVWSFEDIEVGSAMCVLRRGIGREVPDVTKYEPSIDQRVG
jgi:hypothetical protein